MKKLTIVVYANKDNTQLTKTFDSILDSQMKKLDYDVIVINDNTEFSERTDIEINDFIKENKLTNFQLATTDEYLGIANAIQMLTNSYRLRNKYTTILYAGDVIDPNWLPHFMKYEYYNKKDIYFYKMHKTEIFSKPSKDGKFVKYSKTSFFNPVYANTGSLTKNQARQSMPFFFGKIIKTLNLYKANIVSTRILWQEVLLYQEIISASSSFSLHSEVAGNMQHHNWIPLEIEKQHIKILNKTINEMISEDDKELNGVLLQTMIMVMKKTELNKRFYFSLKNHDILLDNYKLHKVPGINMNMCVAKRNAKKISKTGQFFK